MSSALKKSGNPAVSLLQKVLCHQIAAPGIIHKNVELVLHFRVNSLDKNVWNLIFLQIFVKARMPTAKLAFTWLYDQTINIFLKNALLDILPLSDGCYLYFSK